MGILADITSLVTEIARAELRHIQKRIARTVSFLIVGLGLLLAGTILVLWGVYILLTAAVSPAGAAFIVGGAALALAIISIIWASRLIS